MASLLPRTLETIAGWIGADAPRPDAGTWELVPPGGARMAVVLHWGAVAPLGAQVDRCTVSFVDWSHVLEGDDVADDLLDLVAAGLFGLARQRLAVHDDRVEHGILEFRSLAGWMPFARWGRRRWWVRHDERVLRNDLRPPFSLALGCGLSSAPWAGIVGAMRTGAATPVEVPVDGELDLHTYAPAQVASVVEAYLEACRGRGILHVRVVHGKGRGHLRRTVHAVLARHPAVRSFRLGSVGEGSWGATLVELRLPGDEVPNGGVPPRRT